MMKERLIVIKVFFILVLVVTCTNASRSQQEDSLQNHTPGIGWIIVEAGIHPPKLGTDNDGSRRGDYVRASLDIPAWSNVGLVFFIDRWMALSSRIGGGIGMRFLPLRYESFSLSITPSLLAESEMGGFLLPLTLSHELFGGTIRAQVTGSYRVAAKLGPASHSSVSFFTFSGGIGVALK